MQNKDDKSVRGEQSAKAKNFAKLLGQKDVVCFMHFLLDVVDCLTNVSLAFQKKDGAVCDIFSELEAAKTVLNSYKDQNGPHLSSILAEASTPENFDDQPFHWQSKIFCFCQKQTDRPPVFQSGKKI